MLAQKAVRNQERLEYSIGWGSALVTVTITIILGILSVLLNCSLIHVLSVKRGEAYFSPVIR
jgi:hypothetical protein